MFKKWPSIEQNYRTKYIERMCGFYPELLDAQYWISEKIHGSSLQLFFEPGMHWRVGKRTSFIERGEKFYDVWNILSRYAHLTSTFQNVSDMTNISYRIFLEYYGGGIQKGVRYGPEHKLAIFGLMENGCLLAPKTMISVLHNMGFDSLLVPTVGIVTGLQHALEWPVMFDSFILGESDNLCEGVVIRPYDTVYYDNGTPFMLKKKNEKFKANQKPPKKKKEIDPSLAAMRDAFLGYINDARIQGVFSQQGEIAEPSQIGDYIRFILADAREDFIKDFPSAGELSKPDARIVFSAGRKVAELLKGEL